MHQQQAGFQAAGPVAWLVRAALTVAAVLVALWVIAVVGLIVLPVLLGLAIIGYLFRPRVARRAPGEAPAHAQSVIIEGEYEDLEHGPAPFEPGPERRRP